MKIVNMSQELILSSFRYYPMVYQFFPVPNEMGIELPKSLEQSVKTIIDEVEPYTNTPEVLFLDENIVTAEFYGIKGCPDSFLYIECTAILLHHAVSFKIYYSTEIQFLVIDKDFETFINKFNLYLDIEIRSGVVQYHKDDTFRSFIHIIISVDSDFKIINHTALS